MRHGNEESVREATELRETIACEQAEFERFVRRCAGDTLSFARRYVNREEDAWELVIAAFGRLSDSRRQQHPGSERALLRALTLEALGDWFARRRAEPDEEIATLQPRFTDRGTPEKEPRRGRRESSGAASSDPSVIRVAVDMLPDALRVAYVLHDVDDRPAEEVGAILGISKEAARGQVDLSRRALCTILVREKIAGWSPPV